MDIYEAAARGLVELVSFEELEDEDWERPAIRGIHQVQEDYEGRNDDA
jgi:hypothetical protein